MTWTYGLDPQNSDLDAVRFLVGDTDSSDELLQDEEINYLLFVYNNPQRASYYAARSIAAKFSRLCREETGDIEVYANQKHNQYLALAKRIDEDLQAGKSLNVSIFAGGISKSDIHTRDTDPNRDSSPIWEGISDYYPSGPNICKGRLRDY